MADLYILLTIPIIFIFNCILGIIVFCILKRKVKKIIIINWLPIYHTLYRLYISFLTTINGLNVFILFQGNPIFDIVSEYFILLIKSFFKCELYSLTILILQGWMIIDFNIGIKLKKLLLFLFLYELLVQTIFNISLYFAVIISKQIFIFIKTILEQILLLTFIIYCTKKN